ncbi:MAG: hypothetical protein HQL37_06945 [Alphaproteobacteria bacterium]|nr:hypothetical protein [Alphaproteobacteria bacterium]
MIRLQELTSAIRNAVAMAECGLTSEAVRTLRRAVPCAPSDLAVADDDFDPPESAA